MQRDKFIYGPDRQRTQEVIRAMSGATVGAIQRTIWSAQGMEKDIDSVAGTTKILTYLPLGLGFTEEDFTGAVTPSSSATPLERFFHKDHLGSPEVITDNTGAEKDRISYDPWGRLRNPNGLDANWQAITAGALANAMDRTGFTGQEQLDGFSLVHLNGRVYDPPTGRMISPDPTIPEAFDPQSVNRASYVLNSPMAYTDSTGFDSEALQRVELWMAHFRDSFAPDPNRSAYRTFKVSFGLVSRFAAPQLERLAARRGIQLVAIQGCAVATGGACEVLAIGLTAVSIYETAVILADAINEANALSNNDNGANSASAGGAAPPPPDGGDNDKDKVRFGNNPNQKSHALRHIEDAGLDRGVLRDAINQDLSRVGDSLKEGLYNGRVSVNGTQVEYAAYKLPDGTINVGRITPPKPIP